MTAVDSPRPQHHAGWRAAMAALLSSGAFVFLAAICWRLATLFRAADTQHFLPTQGDMKFYSDWALRIADGQWTDHQAFYGLPLYAYLLGGLYALAGFQPYLALLSQVLAEGATAWFIFRLASATFAPAAAHAGPTGRLEHLAGGNLIGWLAALGWVWFVPAQAYSIILMPTTYFVAAFWFVVWWTLKERVAAPRARAFFLLGLFIGFVAMMVANILFLSGFVLAAVCFGSSWSALLPSGNAARWRVRITAAALLFGGIGVGSSPCWLHNYLVAGEPVLLSAHSGINFWIGNNPEATGYPKVPGGMRADQKGLLEDSVIFAQNAVGGPLRHAEVSAYWSAKAHRYIDEHPAAFARLLAVKLGNFWSGYQFDDLGTIQSMQEDGVLLPGLGFGLVAILGLPGLLLACVRWPQARWLAAAVLLHMASLLTVFITERYRLAAVPGLLLLGSFGLVEGARLIAAQRWVPITAYAALLVGAVLLVHRPVPDASLIDLVDYNTGVADLETHHLERARPKLERVYNHNPNNPEAVFAMGNLALAENHNGAAMHFYQRTLQLNPQHVRAMNNLGVLAMSQGQWEAAQALFVRALRIAPQDAKLQYLLTKVCLSLHDFAGARDAIDAAIRLAPGRADYQLLRRQVDRQMAPPVSL